MAPESVSLANCFQTIHMREEHHIDNFDPTSFFTLHDFNFDGLWTRDEVHRMLGFNDGSTHSTPAATKDKYVDQIFDLFDDHNDGHIARSSWVKGIHEGKRIPDFGLGPGHHGDDEYEYEIHHFEKYHDENTKEEDLIHPEDIEHFRKHDQMEDEQIRIDRQQMQQIVEANIPMKFRKQPRRS